MDLFLIHCLCLIWASGGTARQLYRQTAERLMAAALLAWGNIVATSLLLAALHRLGEPAWFLGVSTGLALLLFLLSSRIHPETPAEGAAEGTHAGPVNPWLKWTFIVTLVPPAVAIGAVAYLYEPNTADALAYHLPRAMYYLGQGHLAHFAAADPRQILLPFNFNLLQVFGLVYGPPLQCLNVFNLAAWAVSGLAVYRLCRLCAFGANASLLASWLALMATPVIAQAATSMIDLPVGAALLCALVFALRWKEARRHRDAVLTGLAVGLTTGSALCVPFYGLTAGALLLVERRSGRDPADKGLRAWILPSLLAGALGLPFLLINLAEPASHLHALLGYASGRPEGSLLQDACNCFRPLWHRPRPLADLNEDVAGYGVAGGLYLLSACFCLFRYRSPAGRFAWLGGGGILASLLLSKFSSSSLPGFVPVLLVLSPCVAAVIEAGRTGSAFRRHAVSALVLLVLLATGWSAGIYLLYNTNRPFAPVIQAAFVPPALPPLPLLLDHHLTKQSRINVESDGTNERIFPLLAAKPGQHLTSRRDMQPDAYNLLSRASLSHNSGCDRLGQLPSYILVPIPHKRTAGVEFLATLGRDAAARDYFGIEPHADSIPPVDSSQFLLLTVSADPQPAGDPAKARIKVEGLHPGDQARLVVIMDNYDRSTSTLATFTTDGESTFPMARPFFRLVCKVLDANSGTEIGNGEIPYASPAVAALKPIDPNEPSDGRSILVTDLVLSRQSFVIASEGLLPTEGPFPQWNLPYLRWARRPSITLTIPPIPKLAKLQLSFSVRLHVREKAGLEVLFNGAVVKDYRIHGRATWLDDTLELTPQRGENILEFRDVSLRNEPAWQDYLERYPDVKKHLVTHNIPLEQGALDHYETNGRAEGRTMQTTEVTAPPTDSYYFMFRNIRLEGFKSP